MYLRSQTPVQNIDELRDIKLPVTQLMNANAKPDAADAVQKRSEKVTAQSKKDATAAYNDQVAALKKSRAEAVKAQKTSTVSSPRPRRTWPGLQSQLEAVQQIPVCSGDLLPPGCLPATSDAVLKLTRLYPACPCR